MRTRPGSMTEKCPAQSSRAAIKSASRRPTSDGLGIGMRNRTTPVVDGKADALARSPKSLSNVSRMRSSRTAQANTSGSLMPGAAVLTHTMSWPSSANAATAAPGKFSLARNRILRRAREHPLCAESIAGIGQAGENIVVGKAGVVRDDVGLAPPFGHQADDELDREPRAANHRFAGKNRRIKRNARMSDHGRMAPLSSRRA